jgi:hypothetical protein
MKQHASMNCICGLVWSEASRAWVAVALAGPTGGQIVAGSGSISHSGNTTTLEQSSATRALTSQSFNIAPQQRIDFVQPSSSAIAINGILGANGTPLRLWTSDGRSGYQ